MTPHQAGGANSFERCYSGEKVNEVEKINFVSSLLNYKYSQCYLQENKGVAKM